MITKYNQFIKEGLELPMKPKLNSPVLHPPEESKRRMPHRVNIKDALNKSDQFILDLPNKIEKILSYPIIRYTEKQIKNLSDEEKLLFIAKMSNNIDKVFSPMKNFIFGALASLSLIIFREFITLNSTNTSFSDLYLYFVCLWVYTNMSKKYRLIAKNMFKKIKSTYMEKYKNDVENKDIDPYGEEDWEIEDDVISKANKIRYDKPYTELEKMPFFGLRNKRDVST